MPLEHAWAWGPAVPSFGLRAVATWVHSLCDSSLSCVVCGMYVLLHLRHFYFVIKEAV